MFTYGPGMTAIIILTVNKLGIALQFSFYIRHLLMSIIQVTYLSEYQRVLLLNHWLSYSHFVFCKVQPLS